MRTSRWYQRCGQGPLPRHSRCPAASPPSWGSGQAPGTSACGADARAGRTRRTGRRKDVLPLTAFAENGKPSLRLVLRCRWFAAGRVSCHGGASGEAQMPDLARVAARGASVTVAAQLTRLGLLLVGLTVLSRLLSPSQVGLVAMATSVIGVADIVRDFGLSSAALQAKSLTESERANLWWVNLSIGTACAAVAACLAPVIAHAYGDRRVESVVLVLSTQFILS